MFGLNEIIFAWAPICLARGAAEREKDDICHQMLSKGVRSRRNHTDERT